MSRVSLSKVTVGPRKFLVRVDSLPIFTNSFKDTQETIITPQQSAINDKRQSNNRTSLLSFNLSNNRVKPFYIKVCESSGLLLINLKRLIMS